MPKFVTSYNYEKERKDVGLRFTQPSMTEQEYKDECDVNFIIKNFVKTGELPDMTMQYGDMTTVQDYQDALYTIAEAKSNFYALPSAVRDEFKTVDKYLEYVSDPTHLKDCYERNLIDKNSIDLRDVYPERFVETPLNDTLSERQSSSNPATSDKTPEKT